jgi:hypothetical protein
MRTDIRTPNPLPPINISNALAPRTSIQRFVRDGKREIVNRTANSN